MIDPFIRCKVCGERLHSEFGDCPLCKLRAASAAKPGVISEVWGFKERHNPISGHCWSERDKITGYRVTGAGDWMPTEHRTLKAAEKELALRNQIIKERALRGE